MHSIILNWLSSFITFKTKKVRVNGCVSKNILVSSAGIPKVVRLLDIADVSSIELKGL